MTRRLLGVPAVAAVFGTSGNAVTLVATTDEPVGGYRVGATVTITLTGTTDPSNEMSENIDVRITGAGFVEVSAETARSGTCLAFSGCLPGAPWNLGGTPGEHRGGEFRRLFADRWPHADCQHAPHDPVATAWKSVLHG